MFKKKRISIVLLFALIITVLMSISVCAYEEFLSEPCKICGEVHNMAALEPVQKAAYKMNAFISDGNLFYSSSDGSALTTEKLLRLDINDSSFSKLTQYAKNINSALVPIAVVLCVIWGTLNIISQSTEDMLTPEKLFLSLAKMFVGLFILCNWFDIGTEIINIILNLGTLIFSRLDDSLVGAVPDSPLCNYETVVDSFWAAVFDIVSLAIIFLIMNGVKTAITFLAWIRVIEILIRMAFAPIPMADLPYEGVQSNGFIYLKKLLATVLQASVIVAASTAYSSIIASFTSVSGVFIGRTLMLILAFVVVIIVFKSQSFANDVVGVS